MVKKGSKGAKKLLRIPFALHIFVAMVFVILLSVGTILFFINALFGYFIQSDCDKRLETAVTSCQNFAIAFRSSVESMLSTTAGTTETRELLLNSIISSADISNDATVTLFTIDDDNNVTVIWPSNTYSYSSYNNANDVINTVVTTDGIDEFNTTKYISTEDASYYYRILGIDYSGSSEETAEELENYYICLYVNPVYYYSFMASFNVSILKVTVAVIFVALIASIFVSTPLIRSSVKLSKFAKRISEGNFEPMETTLVTREMNDLGEVMNNMARELEESDIEQKTFFQNASHELRTPLQSIQGYAEGLKYDVFDEDGKNAAVDIIIDESKRLSGMVENLLSISKMDMSKSGNYTVKKKNLDVRRFCELAVENARGNFMLANKELLTDISVQNACIYASSADMLRLLENLFSNSLRYCESKVKFSCHQEDDNVIFTVQDDGPGISDEVAEHLFDRFAKGSDGKHGIGLSLCKAIAEEHGGTIRGFNNPDGGACFEVTIPTNCINEQLTCQNNNK